MTLAQGTRLGPYEIHSLIGSGGMGEVYRATDTNLKRSVAIKVQTGRAYDIAPNGQRFLMIKVGGGADQTASLIVVHNWDQELKRLVPTH